MEQLTKQFRQFGCGQLATFLTDNGRHYLHPFGPFLVQLVRLESDTIKRVHWVYDRAVACAEVRMHDIFRSGLLGLSRTVIVR